MESAERWRVALVYNLKHNVAVGPDAPPDALAEYDSEETAEGIAAALRAGGHEVISLEADANFYEKIRRARVDICFNIAEGVHGDAREAQVPAMLEMLGIPYTGSKVLTQAISLDKAMSKRIWHDCGLPTAPFQVFRRGGESLKRGMKFPLFVKPLSEGSGKGVNEHSTVHNMAELRQQVDWVVQTYRQPALVEGYLPGREFTVGLVGNTVASGEAPLSPFYDEHGFHVFPIMEIDMSRVEGSEGAYGSQIKSDNPWAPQYLIPAPIGEALTHEMQRLAVAAFEAIGAYDLSRVDFRLGADGRPYLMEINTLPGLNPTLSDIVLCARAEGVLYQEIILEVLNQAATRYGMVPAHAWEMPVAVVQGKRAW